MARHGRTCSGHLRLCWLAAKTWMPATSAGMTICSNFIPLQPPLARTGRRRSRYGLFFAVACGAGRMSPQGSTVTFFSGILSIAAL
jgi:hypothetical protein